MSSGLEDAIERAKEMARKLDDSGAMALANELLSQHRDDIRVWMLRGYLHELSEKYEQAKTDLTQAIRINSLEPHLYYSRGRFSYQLGEMQAAVQDFSKGLDLCDYHKSDYYRNELYFWRAATLLKLGDRRGALNDLRALPEDFSSCIGRFQTKRELMEACR